MFQKFWEKNKNIIEFVGIICGVGALFLAIPESVNSVAQKALANMQFIWLIFIAISVVFLFWNIYSYIYQTERELAKKSGFKFTVQGSISYIIFGLIAVFCYSIWQYASALYPQPLKYLIGILSGSLIFFLLSVLLYFTRKIRDKINIILFALLDSFLFSAFTIAGLLTTSIISYGGHFTIRSMIFSWLLTFAVLFLFFIVLSKLKVGYTFGKDNNGKKEKIIKDKK